MVFVDSVPIGQSRDDGWITLNGLQVGSHNIRVSKEGYQDWIGDVMCDGQPKQLVAELQSARNAIPKPPAATVAYSGGIPQNTPQNFADTSGFDSDMQKTSVQVWDTGSQIGVESQPVKKSGLSPILIGVGALLLLFMVGGVGIIGAYMSGLIGGGSDPGNAVNNATPTPAATATPASGLKADMVEIPGGSFKMGRNDGRDNEKPEHDVQVQTFWMDKTEVTNAEYLAFVTESGYKEIPGNWENRKPLPGQEQMPVRLVTLNDAKAFAAWRSKRDGVSYRLPTEQEWEYAARNGAKNSLYPWGDKYEPNCAVLDRENNEPKPVGSASCANDWGVKDLIGNVFEWTSSEATLYPGSAGELAKTEKPHFMVRGGGAIYKSTGAERITSTFRQDIPADTKSPGLGFRLLRN